MRFTRIMSVVMSVSMAVAFAPQVALADQGSDANSIAEQEAAALDSTLAAADYEQGSAIVVVDTSVTDAAAGAVHSTLSGGDLLSGAQDVMDVSASDFKSATGQHQTTDVQVKYVESNSLSTKELIAKLLEDPRVISAEPNVTADVAALDGSDVAAAATADSSLSAVTASSTSSSSSATAVAPKAAVNATNITGTSDMPDLTSYQWYTGTGSAASAGTAGGTMVQPGSNSSSSLAVPNWNEDDNAAGAVVAVMDSGVNYNHPDIQPNMMDMTSYNKGTAYENVAGKYGYCPAGWDKETTSDPMDEEGHGTHVAGIISASRDGKGTTGIASGAKLVAVKITANDSFSYLSCLKGFKYLSTMMDKGLNLTAVNCSWAGNTVSPAITLAMTQLGRKGAVTCIASGNEQTDISKASYSSAYFANSPYAVVVSSSNIRGQQSDFSNYGQGATDIYAPGSSILSTYQTSYAPYVDPSPAYYEDFADEHAASGIVVRKTTEDAAPFGSGQTVGQYSADASFDAGTGSLAIPLDTSETTQYFELLVPVSKEQLEASTHLGLTACGEATMMHVDCSVAVATKKGKASWSYTVGSGYVNTWFGIDAALEDCVQGGDNAAGVALKDGYMSIKLTVSAESAKAMAAGDGVLYLDTVGLGSNVCDYEIEHGTSMATPCATASAAIISTQLAAEGLSGDELALKVTRALKSSVVQSEAMRANSTSGGYLSFTKLGTTTPVVESCSQNGANLCITGAGFGEQQGSVMVGGAEASVASWSDNQVEVQPPSSIASGAVTVTVTGSNGQTGSAVAQVTQGKPALYDKSISLPTASGGPAQSAYTCMAALGNKVYVLCSTHFGDDIIYKQLYSYDVKSGKWTKLAKLPYSKAAVASMTAHRGAIYVACGSVLSRGSTTRQNALYSYTPSTNKWTKVTIGKKLPYATALASMSGRLYAAGGQEADEYGSLEDVKKISWVNLRKKTVTKVGKLSCAMSTAQASASSGVLYVSRGSMQGAVMSRVEKPVVNAFKLVKGKLVRYNLKSALPKAAKGYMNSYAAAATPQGLVISAYPARDANGAKSANDTYVLSLTKKGAAKCKTLGKSFSYNVALQASAVYCKGWYYAIGCAYNDSDTAVMRAFKC